jgi:hypothetical protein
MPRDTIDTTGFVSRPTQMRSGPTPRPGSRQQQLLETADNGKALLLKHGSFSASWFRKKGYRLHQTRNGAPEGWRYVWAERVGDD